MSGFEDVTIPWRGWQVVKELGEGGYGKVYEIERTQPGITDRAALKVIRIPKNQDEYESVLDMLTMKESVTSYFADKKDKVIQEIKVMQDLKANSSIVSIEDWGIRKLNDGYSWEVYIRMELLTPLQRKLREEGNLTEKEIIKLGKDICSALSLCEKKGIVHRDIKPQNILISPNGNYKLGDFGIARELSSATTMTAVYTPPYAAPEVMNLEKADNTIDTYSLGLVMYELLNNRRLPFLNPYKEYSMLERERAIGRRRNGEQIPEPVSGGSGLKRIVLKACSYNPKERYRSANDMKAALDLLWDVSTGNEKQLPKKSPIRGASTPKAEANDCKKPIDVLSLEDLEKDLFGEISVEPVDPKKIENFYALYRKNEEFQKLLDEEYSKLKGEPVDESSICGYIPEELVEPENDSFKFDPEVTPDVDEMFEGLTPSSSQKSLNPPMLSLEDLETDLKDSEEQNNAYHQWADYTGTVGAEKILKKQEKESFSKTRGPVEREDDSKASQKETQNKDSNLGCVVLLLVIGAIALFIFRDKWISLIPALQNENEIFEEYIQGLYENADEYIQGFPSYIQKKGNDGTIYLKYGIADYDGDNQDELLIYCGDSSRDNGSFQLNYYKAFTLPDDKIPCGFLTLYEVDGGEIKEVSQSPPVSGITSESTFTVEQVGDEWHNYLGDKEKLAKSLESFNEIDANSSHKDNNSSEIEKVTGQYWFGYDEKNKEIIELYLEPFNGGDSGKACLHKTGAEKTGELSYVSADNTQKEFGEWRLSGNQIVLNVSLSGDGKSLHSYNVYYESGKLLLDDDINIYKLSAYAPGDYEISTPDESIEYARHYAAECGYDLEKEVPSFSCEFSPEHRSWHIIKAYSISGVLAGLEEEINSYTVFIWKVDSNGHIESLK